MFKRWTIVVSACMVALLSAVAQAADFGDYPAEVVGGGTAPLKLSKSSDFWQFRTRIREGYQEPANFAGHYVLVWWGCGTDCYSGVVIDKLTGRIYSLPTSDLGYEYELESKLLVLDLMQDQEAEYLWNGSGFDELQ